MFGYKFLKKKMENQFPNPIRFQSIVHISTDRCDKLFNENRFPIVCPICVTFLNWVMFCDKLTNRSIHYNSCNVVQYIAKQE